MTQPTEIDPATAQMGIRALQLIQQMEANPEAKAALDRAVKAVRPEHVTAEEEAGRVLAPHLQKVDQLATKFDEYLAAEAARREQEEERRIESQLNDTFGQLRANGYTDDGITKIKELMVERKIADPEAAAALFDRMNPPPPKTDTAAYTPQQWDIGALASDDDDLKLLFQNEDRWEQKQIGNVLNEIRVGRAA